MARSTMATLIARTRRLVNDTGSAIWTDNQIQDVLDTDSTRWDIFQLALDYVPMQTSTTVEYKHYFAPWGWWEEGAEFVLQDNAWATISSGVTLDYLVGKVLFTSSQTPPVFLTGRTYDLYRAAVDLLNERLNTLAPNYAFSAAGQTFQANQEFDMTKALVAQYQAQIRPRALQIVRSDVRAGGW